MTYYSYKEFTPNIGEQCFIAPDATVIGRVEVADHANLWFKTVARGDVNFIKIGKNTNIQDLSMLHVTEENPLVVGSNVSVGHNVVLHACTIEDHCLIGMGAIVLDGVVIGRNSLVAAGSVVPPGKSYPPNSFIIGSPAKAIRELSDDEKKLYGEHYNSYMSYKDEFRNPELFKELTEADLK